MNEKPDYLKVVRCETKGDCVWNKIEDFCSFPGKVVVNEWGRCACFKPNYKKRKEDLKKLMEKIDP